MQYVCGPIINTETPSCYQNILLSFTNINKQLNAILSEWKNKINHNSNWDDMKKYTNKYEHMLYPRFFCNRKRPLSRSYFKLWEILHEFKIFTERSSCKYKTCHIAEGPGGFIECICDYFKKYNISNESIYGITLKSSDKKIPYWKLSKQLLDKFNINLFTEWNGDIYNMDVMLKFIEYVSPDSCDFVTADGGFDFSNDFNNQEIQCQRLLLSQIFLALSTQKIEGCFLLKVFDLFSH